MLQQQSQTPTTLNQNNMNSVVGTTPPLKKQKKSINLRAILTVVGLSLFFVVAMSAVMIAQRQKQVDAPVAPTAPVSMPSADEGTTTQVPPAACQLTFTSKMARPDVCDEVTLKVNNVPKGVGSKDAPIEVEIGDDLDFTIVPKAGAFTATIKPTNYWLGLYNPLKTTTSDPRSVRPICRPKTDDAVAVQDACPTGQVLAIEYAPAGSAIVKPVVQEIFALKDNSGSSDPLTVIQLNGYFADASYNYVSAPIAACVAYIKLVEPVVPGVASCVSKKAFTDYSTVTTATEISSTTALEKGQEFVYRVSVAAADGATSGVVTLTDTLPASLSLVTEGLPAGITNVNGKITVDLGIMGTTGKTSKIVEFKVKVKSDAAAGASIKNTATISTPVTGSTPVAKECSVTHTIKSDLPDYSCNKPCTTTAQCQTVAQGGNALYSCFGTDGAKTCRLTSNTSSTTCEPAKTVSTPTPTPTPAIGCNDKCNTNADCSNPAHVCYDTTLVGQTNGKVCRLANYVESTSCTTPTVASNPSTPTQPSLPAALPQTGPEEWLGWFKAGLVTLGVGAALLLLL